VQSLQEKIVRSVSCLQNGDPAQALTLCRSVLASKPNHPEALNILGVASFQLGDCRKAIEYAQRAVRLKPAAPDFHSNLGRYYLSLGKLAEASQSIEQALQLKPDHSMAQFNLSAVLIASGRGDEGVAKLREYTSAHPQDPVAWNQLGLLLLEQMRPAEALPALERAVELRPDSPDIRNNLGNALQSLNRHQEALSQYIRSFELRPDNSDAASNIGTVMQSLERFTDAELWFQEALRCRPNFFPARGNLASLYLAQRRFDVALPLLEALAEERPSSHECWNNLGNCLMELGRYDQSLDAYRRVLQIKPEFYPAHNNIGNVYRRLGRLEEALVEFDRALAGNPEFVEGHNNRGVVLMELGRGAEAIAVFDRALEIRPNYADPLVNQANYWRDHGRLTKSVDLLRRALSIKANSPWTWNNLGCVLSDLGMVGDAIACYAKSIEVMPDNHHAHSNLLLNMHYLPQFSTEQIFQEHRRFASIHEPPVAALRRPFSNPREPERPLRVGYVSSDFRRHSVAFFLEPVLEGHDRGQVDLFCYSDVLRPDNYTERFRRLAGAGWRDVRGASHEGFAEIVRRDAIDILVDTGGHTANSRLLSFAAKPAPIQVTWIGYPDTTGLDAMDYRITDVESDPPGLAETWHSERLVRLPETFLCYRPAAGIPDAGPPPAASGKAFTFGSFNNMSKIGPATITIWSGILQQAKGTRLLIKNKALAESELRDWVLEQFAEHGIGPERLVLKAPTPGIQEHLVTYAEVDLALDTFPYHGTTTTCEALWMGVPVLTLAGVAHVSRVGCSLLRHAGLEDHITFTPQEYVAKAVALAGTWREWAALRTQLRARLARSPLMDERRFVTHLEEAYRMMWRAWCAGGQA